MHRKKGWRKIEGVQQKWKENENIAGNAHSNKSPIHPRLSFPSGLLLVSLQINTASLLSNLTCWRLLHPFKWISKAGIDLCQVVILDTSMTGNALQPLPRVKEVCELLP